MALSTFITALPDAFRHGVLTALLAALLNALSGFDPARADERAPQQARPVLEIRLPIDQRSDYCKGVTPWDRHSEYHVELLRLAIRLSGRDITITPVCMDYPTEERRVSMLLANDPINTVHFGTSQDREDKLLAAYVPIYLGTTGLRLFMVLNENLPALESVRSMDDLRKFSMGQGLGWPDTKILIENGFSVSDGRYNTLHKMLDAKRFDLYPRAFWQILGEWRWMKEQAPNIKVSPEIGLYYSQPIYFFFAPGEPELRDAIQTGLERVYSNGLMFELLKNHPETAPSFHLIDLRKLRVILGTNKNLPEKSKEVLKTYGLFD